MTPVSNFTIVTPLPEDKGLLLERPPARLSVTKRLCDYLHRTFPIPRSDDVGAGVEALDESTDDVPNLDDFDDEVEDLYNSDMNSVSDGDDKDSFINDHSTNYYAIDGEDADDEF
ncbi:hypothetical protein Tco_1418652 [Tanacetum coccineum]